MSRSQEIPTRDGKVAVRITGSLPQLVAIGPRLPVTYTKSSENKESPVKPSVYDTVSSIPVPPTHTPSWQWAPKRGLPITELLTAALEGSEIS